MSQHRVEITFDDGVYLKLICPEKGCVPESECVCASCGRDPHDPDAGARCYDCSEPSNECWIKSWADNLSAEELLRGTITLPVRAVADAGDGYITLEIESEVEQ